MPTGGFDDVLVFAVDVQRQIQRAPAGPAELELVAGPGPLIQFQHHVVHSDVLRPQAEGLPVPVPAHLQTARVPPFGIVYLQASEREVGCACALRGLRHLPGQPEQHDGHHNPNRPPHQVMHSPVHKPHPLAPDAPRASA
jgi:hypothetical protein